MSGTRARIAAARRVVVKVGSSSLTTAAGGLDPERLDALVDALVTRRRAGSQVVLVSSGAIASGLAPLRLNRRPRDLATQQASASVGQLVLGHAYVSSFARFGLPVGQVLLTSDDVVRRAHYRNAQRTLSRLLALGVVPVVNENDTVATEEIRFGDNDRLAALVAYLVGADALVLLSDVDGLYDGDPRRGSATRITEVVDASDVVHVQADDAASDVGSGGMASKLTSARLASTAGVPVLIAAATDAARALGAADVGTAFAASARRLTPRRFWLAYAANPKGRLYLDDGAVAAVVGRRRSLLAAGITEVTGEFEAGDVVELANADGRTVARGVVAYDAAELPALIGRKTHDLAPEHRREIVHADDLVPLRH
ncbi:MAG TPA: glutamate 5-kinase [Actinophytocola sp.]|uniref:glutamate 5-kinase n=1 Tax=Actinophytocola sp. TaxID=1872138 RepID=UPI002F93A3A6